MPSDLQKRVAIVYGAARFNAAAAILAGGLLHIAGLAQVFSRSANLPWYDWLVYVVAMVGYPMAAYLIVRDRKPGYAMAVLGPCIGGLLIFTGFVTSSRGLVMLIPGTILSEITPAGYQPAEITLAGFLTLIIEPVAVASSLVCLYLGRPAAPGGESQP